MQWKDLNWQALESLRETFLSEHPWVGSDYWKNTAELEAYDLTFAQRIGWKWDAVLREVKARNWAPPAQNKRWILDWGCGTGIATRRFLSAFSPEGVSGVYVWDRSRLARGYAKEAIAKEFSLPVEEWNPEGTFPTGALVLLSHVLGELDEGYGAEVLQLISQAGAVFWVEPGTPFLSRKLIGVREHLLEDFDVVAPCPHRGKCGMLSPDNEAHWCHNFAEPPSSAFQSSEWATFSKRLGIDLRSLPVSFLVMQRKDGAAQSLSGNRIIGRPRLYKGMAKILVCGSEGVSEKTLLERRDPALHKSMKRNAFTTVLGDDSVRQDER